MPSVGTLLQPTGGSIEPWTEFTVNLAVSLPTPSSQAYHAASASRQTLQFMFEAIDVTIATVRNNKRFRLPLWDGVSVRDGAVIGKIHSVTAHSSASVVASV